MAPCCPVWALVRSLSLPGCLLVLSLGFLQLCRVTVGINTGGCSDSWRISTLPQLSPPTLTVPKSNSLTFENVWLTPLPRLYFIIFFKVLQPLYFLHPCWKQRCQNTSRKPVLAVLPRPSRTRKCRKSWEQGCSLESPDTSFADPEDLEKPKLPKTWTSLQSQQELGNFGPLGFVAL